MISETDKRLQTLKTQLYGKGQTVQISATPKSPSLTTSAVITTSVHSLRHDLTKIAILATLAIGAQIILYITLNAGLVKF